MQAWWGGRDVHPAAFGGEVGVGAAAGGGGVRVPGRVHPAACGGGGEGGGCTKLHVVARREV